MAVGRHGDVDPQVSRKIERIQKILVDAGILSPESPHGKWDEDYTVSWGVAELYFEYELENDMELGLTVRREMD